MHPQQQQQQQPAPMLPPPPTKLSAWELAELPILLEYLAEQVAEKSAELPLGISDPEWLLQQMEESVAAARAKEEGDAGRAVAVPAAPAQQLQQHAEQQQLTAAEAAAAAARWNAACGPLMLQPFAPDEMPAGFGEQWRSAQALLRSSGMVGGLGGAAGEGLGHEATTEVVGETDPDAGSVGTASWDNRSAGSIGGSRGVAGGAAANTAVGVGGSGRGRGGVGGGLAVGGDGLGAAGHVRGQVKRGASASQMREPAGVMQAKSIKRQQVMKGIGMKR
jgi:hypothetical protein